MTVHKAQGLTTQVALLYGTDALCQQAGYVALSRGRQANHLYTSATSLVADRAGIRKAPARFELLGPDPTDVASRLAQQLASTAGTPSPATKHPPTPTSPPTDLETARAAATSAHLDDWTPHQPRRKL